MELRRGEVLAVLALATDLAMGHPHELAMRAGLLAGALAERVGVPPADAPRRPAAVHRLHGARL